MADANISILSTTIVNSYSSQDSNYPWSNLLDGLTTTNGRSAVNNPNDQWIIIDLGQEWPLTGFKLWNSTLSSNNVDVQTFKIDVSNTGIADGDFIEVVPESFIFSEDLGGVLGSRTRAIPSTYARYIKLHLLTNYGSNYYIAASDFEIYTAVVETETKQIQSDATIFLPTETVTISSDAVIYLPTFTDRINITSNAVITDTRSDKLSDAYIVGDYIYSDASITAAETVTISSDAVIYRDKTFIKDMILFGQANTVSGSKNMAIFTTDFSSSDEVIVNDMITSTPLDMTTIEPPLGYNNYDWKYDWVVRTYNRCQYKFEIRTADTLIDLYAEPFREIELNEQVYKGQVARYHQWRCHVWASGSGDFELHQFTIKGYVDNPANPLYRMLRDKPFTTTSHVAAPQDTWFGDPQIYEPPLDSTVWRGSYLPGDMDGDFDIDIDDYNALFKVVFNQTVSIPAPGSLARGDWTNDGSVDISDLVAFQNYYSISAGRPPKKYEKLK